MFLEWLFRDPDLHRSFTHSLLFSFGVAVVLFLWMGPEEMRAVAAFSLAYLSHPLLDLIASTKGGVKLFYPFSDEYFHLGLIRIFELPTGTTCPKSWPGQKSSFSFSSRSS